MVRKRSEQECSRVSMVTADGGGEDRDSSNIFSFITELIRLMTRCEERCRAAALI